MREIHDLTLSLSRNLDRIEKTLSDRSRGFKEEFRRLETPDHAFGLRYTAIQLVTIFKSNECMRMVI